MFSCFKDKTFLSKFVNVAFPVMISAFVTFLVSFIDNIMVGTVSNNAVSGVYAANEVTFIYNLMVFGIIEGAGIFIQQFHGKGDLLSEKKCFNFKIISVIIFMIIFLPIFYLLGRNIVWFFCKSDINAQSIYEEGKNYLNLIIISYIPFSIGYIYSTTLREIGETKYAMYASFSAIIINSLFNAIFIIVLKWGVVGAALATIIARTIEMLVVILICHKKKFGFCNRLFSQFILDKELSIKIIKRGSLLFINEIGFAFGTIAQSLAFSQRDGVLSAISILTTVTNVMTILIQGLSAAIGVILGQDLGQSDFNKAWKDNIKLNLLAFYMCIFTGIILAVLSHFIPNLFTKVDDSQKIIATKLILCYSCLLVFNCWSITCYYTLKAGGKTLQTLLLDTGSLFIIYLPVAWIIALYTNLNIIWFYIIVRGLDILRAFVGFILVSKKKWLNNLTIEN